MNISNEEKQLEVQYVTKELFLRFCVRHTATKCSWFMQYLRFDAAAVVVHFIGASPPQTCVVNHHLAAGSRVSKRLGFPPKTLVARKGRDSSSRLVQRRSNAIGLQVEVLRCISSCRRVLMATSSFSPPTPFAGKAAEIFGDYLRYPRSCCS